MPRDTPETTVTPCVHCGRTVESGAMALPCPATATGYHELPRLPEEESMPKTINVGQRWQFRQNRGDRSYTFTVVKLVGDKVHLSDGDGKVKRVNTRTLRGDYERIDG